MKTEQKALITLLNSNILYLLILIIGGFFGYLFYDFITTKESFLHSIAVQMSYVLIIPFVVYVYIKMENLTVHADMSIKTRNRLLAMFKPWKKTLIIYSILIFLGLVLIYFSLSYKEYIVVRKVTGVWIGSIIGFSVRIIRIYHLLNSYSIDLFNEQEQKKKREAFNRKFHK